MSPALPLIDPASYFERRDDPLPAGLGVFVLHVVAVLALAYYAITLVLDSIENPPDGLERAMADVLPIMLVSVLAAAVIGLLVVAAIVHYGSGGSSTAGSFGDAVAVAGWAYAPDLLAAPLKHLNVRRVVGDLALSASDPEALQAQIEAAQSSTGPVGLLLQAGVAAWSVYILAHGTAATHDVDFGTALVPALAVGLGSLLLTAV